ncbi:antitermination regulator [Mycobacterium sp. E2462]|uniref:PAS and ANTAR domain-containing protein n=1 Tax=unclassified Mycobacterium TaxID=2642494 RepID=UPI0007FCE4BC|nr:MULTISPECIES: PAS and ANTAR domain-containing protein [unclassified Mycobacterium]OBG73790.1 antitermination regulator [Mycobacterium sp. E1214]OBH22396.1 antitermination regulator [Mycobacterium sp. E1319]OBI23067.1 antitermination regulator [Mycobacterium sp. E2462]
MKWELDGQTGSVEQALTGGTAHPAGWFRFHFTDQRWEWSNEVQRIYGYEPGSVTPTTELVLSHKHPDDRPRVRATIDQIVHARSAFGTRHRIIDTRGRVRHVMVVADKLVDAEGDVVGTHGFIVDVTPGHDHAHEDMVTAKLAEISEHRASIEQAKGMLMLVYDLDDGSAFDLLKWLSQEANLKLRTLAEQITADFRRAGLADRSEFDHLLLTAHRRVRRTASGG